MKEWIKWGVILVVGYLALRWLLGAFSSGAGVGTSAPFYQGWPAGGTIVGPLPVTGWVAPWQTGRRRRRAH